MPQSSEEWLQEAHQFDQKWQYPHCLGAFDGRHIAIDKPPHSGSHYFNYKGFYSIILMAVVNAEYEFVFVDVGANGRVHDGGVFANTAFAKKLYDNTLNLPDASPLPEGEQDIPYVFLADDAFPLTTNIMKPYKQTGLEKGKEVYNYRVSRGRQVVECSFGILVTRFRVLTSNIHLSPTKAAKVTLCCCYLHNFLMKRKCKSYIDNSSQIGLSEALNPHNLLVPLQQMRTYNDLSAKAVRDAFCSHFNNAGAVHWQDKKIYRRYKEQ
ncbi:unnamed protein product, partial [Meganyctiphanes norvegica]